MPSVLTSVARSPRDVMTRPISAAAMAAGVAPPLKSWMLELLRSVTSVALHPLSVVSAAQAASVADNTERRESSIMVGILIGGSGSEAEVEREPERSGRRIRTNVDAACQI